MPTTHFPSRHVCIASRLNPQIGECAIARPQRLHNPKPTDLTNPQALRFKTDAERLQVLKNGIPGTGMVSLVPIVISEEEASAVIAYLHTLLGEP